MRSSGLFPDSLFKARVAAFNCSGVAFDDGFKVFVHSGLHEFGLGDGGGLNGAGGRRPAFRKSLPLLAFPRRSEYLSYSMARSGFEGENRVALELITDSMSFVGQSGQNHAANRSSCRGRRRRLRAKGYGIGRRRLRSVFFLKASVSRSRLRVGSTTRKLCTAPDERGREAGGAL